MKEGEGWLRIIQTMDDRSAMKSCPFCQELVPAQETKCPRCFQLLEEGPIQTATDSPTSPADCRSDQALPEATDFSDSTPEQDGTQTDPEKSIEEASVVGGGAKGVAVARTSGNYILQHWRGEHSLARSYWINGVGVALVVAFAWKMLDAFNTSIEMRIVSILAILLIIANVMLAIWRIVGIYRSSKYHVARGGKPRWATTAQVMVVIMVLVFAGEWPHLSTHFWEQVSILRGDPQGPRCTFALSADRTELELRGGINAGSASRLKVLLDANPDVTLITLTSEGGRVLEGLVMANLVRERGLSTRCSSFCASAATLPFIAGRERILEAGAKLGFHHSLIPAGVRFVHERPDHDPMRLSMEKDGISVDFIKRALETPSSSLWCPTPEELKAAGVITRESVADLEKALSNLPVFDALKSIDQKSYESIVKDVANALRGGNLTNAVFWAARERIEPLMIRFLPAASDAAVLAVASNWVNVIAAGKVQDSSATVAALSGHTAATNIAFLQSLPLTIRTEGMVAAEMVFRSAKGVGSRELNIPEVLADLYSVRRNLRQRFGEDYQLIGQQDKWAASAPLVSELLQAYYEEILQLPPARASQALRYAFSISSASAPSDAENHPSALRLDTGYSNKSRDHK